MRNEILSVLIGIGVAASSVPALADTDPAAEVTLREMRETLRRGLKCTIGAAHGKSTFLTGKSGNLKVRLKTYSEIEALFQLVPSDEKGEDQYRVEYREKTGPVPAGTLESWSVFTPEMAHSPWATQIVQRAKQGAQSLPGWADAREIRFTRGVQLSSKEYGFFELKGEGIRLRGMTPKYFKNFRPTLDGRAAQKMGGIPLVGASGWQYPARLAYAFTGIGIGHQLLIRDFPVAFQSADCEAL